MSGAWQAVIGLEVHIQLDTRSKLFSGAPTAFGAPPNAQACAVDLALPGTLPVLNAQAVHQAVLFGLATGGRIAASCRFERKNYFYPDLPKGYQISQFDEPIVSGGHIAIDGDDGRPRRIALTRAHLEEDAGKSLHESHAGCTGIDFNRAGMPLLEVVGEPALRSPDEAERYFRALHLLARYLGICAGDLSEGAMRCDANVSVHRPGTPLGVRAEIKNLNSFRFLGKAIGFEIDRQIDVLESGGAVRRETRLYDADRHETRSMRGKEAADDYRYFPDPDLLPLRVTERMLADAHAALPELPDAKRARYAHALGLGAYDARRLAADPHLAAYFDAVAERCGRPKDAANWLLGETAAALNREALPASAIPIPAAALARLIERAADGTLSSRTAKALFGILWDGGDAEMEGSAVDALIERRGLAQVRDAGELAAIVAATLAANPRQAAQYRAGKTKLLGFFVGQVMRATGGKAHPEQANALLREALDRQR